MLGRMFGLSDFWTALIATAVLSLAGLAYLLIGWIRKRSGRVLVRGIGFILIPIGLMVMGWMELAVTGVKVLNDWALSHTMTLRIEIGLGILAAGLVCFLIGTFMAPIVGEAAKQRRAELKARREVANPAAPTTARPATVAAPATGAPLPATPVKTGSAAAPSRTGAAAPSTSAAIDPATDDEIDAILRRHGIQ